MRKPYFETALGKLYNMDCLEFMKTMPDKGVSLQRYKGLGEMNPEQLWRTTMDPEKRTLLQVNLDDGAEADHLFNILMGSETAPRSQFIHENAQYVRNLDV